MDALFNTNFGQFTEKYGTEYNIGDSGIGGGYLFANTNIVVGFNEYQTVTKNAKLTDITLISENPLSILGIRTRMSLKEVVKVLGQPTSKGIYESVGGMYAEYQIKGYKLLLLFNDDFSEI